MKEKNEIKIETSYGWLEIRKNGTMSEYNYDDSWEVTTQHLKQDIEAYKKALKILRELKK